MRDRRAAECVSVDAVHTRVRTTWCLGALLAGCAPTPPEVTGTGLETGNAGTTGDAGTTSGRASEGSATMASVEGTGTSGDTITGLPLDGTTTGEPTSATTDDGASSTSDGDATTGEPEMCHPILAEVLYDPQGMNNRKQWVKLYNPCDVEIVLAGAYVLAYGGDDGYLEGQLELTESIAPGACRVVGGPDSNNDNANPVWGQHADFAPDLQVSENPGGGVGLFVGAASDLTEESRPVDAVIYGENNDYGFIDPDGMVVEPHVIGTGQRESIRRTSLAAEWEVAMTPTPNECPEL